MTKTIAFINQKGGVGKTTSSVTMATALSNRGFKVLAIDIDPQANLSQSLNISDSEKNIYRWLKRDCEFSPIAINDKLDAIPSSIDLNALETELASEPGREFILKEVLTPYLSRYDFVCVDCSPSLGLGSINVLTTANIPVLPHPLSINGLTDLLSVTNKIKGRLNEKLQLEGVIVTHYDKRTVIHRNIYDSLQKHFKEALYKTTIRKNIALVEASYHGQSIFEYAPKSHGAIDYQAFCDEFLLKNK